MWNGLSNSMMPVIPPFMPGAIQFRQLGNPTASNITMPRLLPSPLIQQERSAPLKTCGDSCNRLRTRDDCPWEIHMTLEHLDTLIAFVVIITGVSLMVTLLTQMVSAVLGLRGTNLRWGVATLLKELDPSLAEYAKKI